MEPEQAIFILEGSKAYHKIASMDQANGHTGGEWGYTYYKTKCGRTIGPMDYYQTRAVLDIIDTTELTPCLKCYPEYNGHRGIHWSQTVNRGA